MLAPHDVSDSVGEIDGLAASQRVGSVAETAEVSEGKSGRAPIDRGGVRTHDAKFLFDVRAAREVGHGLAHITAEGERSIVVEARLKAMAPGGCLTGAVTVGRVLKPEESRGGGIALLVLNVEADAVSISGQRHHQAQGDGVAGAWLGWRNGIVLNDSAIQGQGIV